MWSRVLSVGFVRCSGGPVGLFHVVGDKDGEALPHAVSQPASVVRHGLALGEGELVRVHEEGHHGEHGGDVCG
uniref:Uncharacterized protein n=1 Tax=uncultured marine virus TaxID=186617 RepID=A0A0F7L6M9_9VIRU|nr:hypothetical protein [uncultured marine virus]